MSTIRVTITGTYTPNPSDYGDPGDADPTTAEMARVDAANYASGGVSEVDLIDWLEPDSFDVTFEATA